MLRLRSCSEELTNSIDEIEKEIQVWTSLIKSKTFSGLNEFNKVNTNTNSESINKVNNISRFEQI